MVAHIFNPSAEKVEASLVYIDIPDQPGLLREALSQKRKKEISKSMSFPGQSFSFGITSSRNFSLIS